jgi:hypothetical protein
MVKSIVFKVSVRRRLGGKAQLEVEASHRHGKWSKATLCMRRRRLQRKGKGKAPAAAFRRQGKGPAATADAGESSSGGGCCRGRGLLSPPTHTHKKKKSYMQQITGEDKGIMICGTVYINSKSDCTYKLLKTTIKKGQPGACGSHLHRVRGRVRPLWVLCRQSFPTFLKTTIDT